MPAPARGRGGRPTPQGPFACQECGKVFERKEYRDKHYRRCLRAANEPRQTRQRSCVSCVASKLGCDQRLPTCSRCALRGRRCQYATGPKSHPRSEQPDTNLSGPEELVQHELTIHYDDSLGPEPGLGAGDEEAEMDLNPNGALSRNSGSANGHGLGDGNGNGNGNGAWAMNNANVAGQQSPDRSMKDVNMMSDWLRQSPSQQGFLLNNDSTYRWPSRSPSLAMGEATSMAPEWDDTFQFGMMGMGNDMNFDLLGSLGVLPPRSTVPSVTPAPRPLLSSRRNTEPAPQQPPQQQQQPSTTLSTSHQDQTFRDYIPTSYTQQATATTLLTQPTHQLTSPISTSPPSTSCPFAKLTSDLDTIDIICSYPRLMLRPGIYPPFVHHKIYPCAEGEILEPLAKAFCCVGAFYASVKTSEGFVYQLMNNESRRLVNGFQLWSTSDHSMLAAVHAMAIYQILGFFTSTNPEQTRLAELQQLFFLKMVRKLISTHLPPRQHPPSSSPATSSQSTINNSNSNNSTDEAIFGTDWRKWLITETIRRTVFLANTINTLSYRTQKQNPYYYEALDDDSVLNMLLPAPMSVWKASSEEEWLAARGTLSAEERGRARMTVRMVLDQVSGQRTGTGGGGSGGRSGRRARDRERERVNFEELDEFTRVVISMAKAY
ncbi:hypothetical protein ASPCAL06115 [Aspergillus calidoustus]|uniref:Zn(2)-C6 fungal-type domain-containing protein n=1 Tax=Aspergillus calidoustus TaxID=454130 RepID=A0A0U5FZE8_ASPCI|nr:hypothetical protein ASPCAL06115 [Aspergillus calidoustus]